MLSHEQIVGEALRTVISNPEAYRQCRIENDGTPLLEDFDGELVLDQINFFRGLVSLPSGIVMLSFATPENSSPSDEENFEEEISWFQRGTDVLTSELNSRNQRALATLAERISNRRSPDHAVLLSGFETSQFEESGRLIFSRMFDQLLFEPRRDRGHTFLDEEGLSTRLGNPFVYPAIDLAQKIGFTLASNSVFAEQVPTGSL